MYVKVLAGDITEGHWSAHKSLFGSLSIHRTFGQTINLTNEMDSVEIQTEKSVKKLAGTVGWGVLGMLALGPLGAIGGVLLGGRGKEVMFSAVFKDGRRFLGICDGNTWAEIAAINYKKTSTKAALSTSSKSATTPNGVWHYLNGNNEASPPVDEDEIKKLVEAGFLNAKSLVWRAGFEKWVSVAETELSKLLSPSRN